MALVMAVSAPRAFGKSMNGVISSPLCVGGAPGRSTALATATIRANSRPHRHRGISVVRRVSRDASSGGGGSGNVDEGKRAPRREGAIFAREIACAWLSRIAFPPQRNLRFRTQSTDHCDAIPLGKHCVGTRQLSSISNLALHLLRANESKHRDFSSPRPHHGGRHQSQLLHPTHETRLLCGW